MLQIKLIYSGYFIIFRLSKNINYRTDDKCGRNKSLHIITFET